MSIEYEGNSFQHEAGGCRVVVYFKDASLQDGGELILSFDVRRAGENARFCKLLWESVKVGGGRVKYRLDECTEKEMVMTLGECKARFQQEGVYPTLLRVME